MITPLVPHYGSKATLRPLLMSLASEIQGVKPLIGDDSDSLRQHFGPAGSIVVPGPHRGFAANANLLAKNAKSEWLLLINNDVILHVGWGKRMKRFLAKCHPKVGLVASVIWRPNGSIDSFGDGFSWQLARPVKLGRYTSSIQQADLMPRLSVSGAVMIVRRAAWEELNGLDEGFGQYCEDVDFGWRATAAGWHIKAAPFCHSTHAEGSSYCEIARTYYGARNNIWLIRRHLPGQSAELIRRARTAWTWREQSLKPESRSAVLLGLTDGINQPVPPAPSAHRASRSLKRRRLPPWREAVYGVGLAVRRQHW